jgi:hypothetical protein
MIIPSKFHNALSALQALIIQARFMAYKQEDYTKIVIFLGYAETLIKLIMSDEDQTASFRKILEEIANKHNNYYALEKFDNNKL